MENLYRFIDTKGLVNSKSKSVSQLVIMVEKNSWKLKFTLYNNFEASISCQTDLLCVLENFKIITSKVSVKKI